MLTPAAILSRGLSPSSSGPVLTGAPAGTRAAALSACKRGADLLDERLRALDGAGEFLDRLAVDEIGRHLGVGEAQGVAAGVHRLILRLAQGGHLGPGVVGGLLAGFDIVAGLLQQGGKLIDAVVALGERRHEVLPVLLLLLERGAQLLALRRCGIAVAGGRGFVMFELHSCPSFRYVMYRSLFRTSRFSLTLSGRPRSSGSCVGAGSHACPPSDCQAPAVVAQHITSSL